MDAGAHGIRPSSFGSTQHSRRSAESGNAVDDELEDQISRVFRPFAPSILEEHVEDYFQLGPGSESP